MKNIVLVGLFLFTLGLILPQIAIAKLGVGVGLGKIQIDEELSPGGIYKLPTLPVLNTGDEDAEYEVTVTYLSEQKELQPKVEWFTFAPQTFPLKAGASQQVAVTLSLPVNVRPGNYFAFLEAHPMKKAEGVTIGVAAATKLNFSVKPAGVLGAAAERIRSIFETNAPFSYIIVGIIGGLIVLGGLTVIGRRYLTIQIGIKKGVKKKEEV